MTWFKNRSIGIKMAFLVGLPLCLLLFITAYNYRMSKQTLHEFTSAYDNVYSQAANIAIVRSALNAEQRAILKMILIEDEAKCNELREEINKRREESAGFLKEFEGTPIDETAIAYLNNVKELKGNLADLQDEVIELAFKNEDEKAEQLFLSKLEPVAVRYTENLRKLSAYLVGEADETDTEMEAQIKRTIVIGVGVALAATFLSLLFSFFVSRMITKPINLIKEKIGVFASGDLSVDFSDSGKDAISQMSNALEGMVETLRHVVESIQNSGVQITDSAQNFSAMAQETNASVEEFRASIDEMGSDMQELATAAEEVNASVEEVAAGAQLTAEKGTNIACKVDEAMEAGNLGMDALHNVVSGIGKVAEDVESTAAAVLELSSRAQQIQNFVSQIAGIADQTNLLALNAAIEAARAGDAGRGFAVVAEEVRKLAEESNTAAKNIAGLAGAIATDLNTITGYAQDNTTTCGAAKVRSSETEKAIANILDSLREIATATQDLAAVAEEQAASSEEIASNVQGISEKVGNAARLSENIRTGVGEVATASETIATDAESLYELSHDLQAELDFFKMENGTENSSQPAQRQEVKSLPKARPAVKALKARLATAGNA
ncbi:MAG: methyl-accepting chemotaxis protein [Synergistaceae bacterium]|jgi:methyl-accepting chemotaxis protein|nr:methyl-accepting chemotaxis protein [Synergistaceae bacterium]